MNNVILVGRLTRDPEIQYIGNESTALTKFNLAVDRNYTNTDKEKKADFIDIEVWGRQAETCSRYLNKGSMACIKGQIRVDRYQNSNGENRYSTKVRADMVKFLSFSKNTSTESNQDQYYDATSIFNKTESSLNLAEDELPF